jgi:hypothetical protein
MDRIDWLPKGSMRPVFAFFESEQAAKVAEWRLKFAGISCYVRWFDAAVYAS